MTPRPGREPPAAQDLVAPLPDDVLDHVIGGAGTVAPPDLERILRGAGLGLPPVPPV